jgi:hypothetical protein
LPTLAKVVEALGTTIPEVLADEGANLARAGRLPAAGEGAVWLSHPELQLKVVALASRPSTETSLPLPTKDYDVFGYVVQGELQVTLDSREPVTLAVGDALDLRSVRVVLLASRPGAISVWTSCPVRS